MASDSSKYRLNYLSKNLNSIIVSWVESKPLESDSKDRLSQGIIHYLRWFSMKIGENVETNQAGQSQVNFGFTLFTDRYCEPNRTDRPVCR
jgi:cytochrome c